MTRNILEALQNERQIRRQDAVSKDKKGKKPKDEDVFEDDEDKEAGAGGADLITEGVRVIDFAYLERVPRAG